MKSQEALDLVGDANFYFLDVRTIDEHKNKSISNTDCIPIRDLENRIDELNKFKEKKIIVYCISGNRSRIGTEILNSNGINSYNMIGGMNSWKGKVESDK